MSRSPAEIRLSLLVFLLGTLISTILFVLFDSRGPEEVIGATLVLWLLPALMAVAARKEPTAIRRYGLALATLGREPINGIPSGAVF